MALQFTAVANSIAGLSVSGVTLVDIDELPNEADTRTASIIPAPNWLTDFDVEYQSFGGGSSALMDLSYTLTYRILFAPVGSGRALGSMISQMKDKVGLFLDAILAVDTLTGLITIVPISVTGFPVVPGPSSGAVRKDYYGCDISVRILEFGPND